MILLICINMNPLDNIYPRENTKLDFLVLNCSGRYDSAILAKFNFICFDCYRQFMDQAINRKCRYVLT